MICRRIIIIVSIGVLLAACSKNKKLTVDEYAEIFHENEQVFQAVADEFLIAEKREGITHQKGNSYSDEKTLLEAFNLTEKDVLYSNVKKILDMEEIRYIKFNDDSIEFVIAYPVEDVTYEYFYSTEVRHTTPVVKVLTEDENWSLVFIPHI